MRRTPQIASKFELPSWQLALCLVLATLFLYNPFFAVHGSSQSLKVEHRLSYRATVASSELDCGTVDQAKRQIQQPQAGLPRDIHVANATPLVVPDLPSEPLGARLFPELFANVWSRPPPVSVIHH
jgi:hypothetical protein